MRQKLGRIAWEYTHRDGHFYGWHYCVGYCPCCKTKQVITQEQINEFNKNSSTTQLIFGKFLTKIKGVFYCFKHLRRVRIRFEIAKNTENIFDTANLKEYNDYRKQETPIIDNRKKEYGL